MDHFSDLKALRENHFLLILSLYNQMVFPKLLHYISSAFDLRNKMVLVNCISTVNVLM